MLQCFLTLIRYGAFRTQGEILAQDKERYEVAWMNADCICIVLK